MVEAECIHNYTLIKFDSQNGPFEPRKQLYGNQISRGMEEGECIHRENLIPKTALLSQKEALRESNFQRHSRRRMYTHRKFDPQNGSFEPESSFTGIKNSKGMVEGECKHIEGFIRKTALLSQKEALRESNFKRYGRRRVYTHRRFDLVKFFCLCNAWPFRAKKQLYGNQKFKRYGRRRV